ncbi:MAG: transporter substrate-binding domain-containing protein, partial [Candidatus Limnocylindrales bacterium]
MPSRRIAVVISTFMLALAACGGGAGTSGSPSAGASGGSPSAAASGGSPSAGSPDDMLARIKSNGVIRVATDANYAPQSFLKPDGTGEGFDIDVANEIAKRLGVTAEFQYPQWAVIEGGNWADRFDISVGSMTVTETRKNEIFDMTQPYYYTPAQMSVITDSGITSLDGL